ncbi:MAG: LbtU family siderophore porin [Magnetococcus sp. DMHC-1]|nr:LbtU family siderophore porin [Magnetococcales bacterium]
MKMRTLAMALPLAMGASTVAFAADLPTREEMWQIIQKQQRELDALKTQIGQGQKEAPAAASQESGKGDKNWSERVKIGGLVKVDATAGKTFAGAKYSDITVTEANLVADATISDWSTGHVKIIYEEAPVDGIPADRNPLRLEEASITLGNPEKLPVYLTVGRLVTPLTTYTTNLIEDPLTLTLARSKETVAQVGFESNGVYGSGWVFNGDVNRTGQNDTAGQGGINLGYKVDNKTLKLDVGGGLTNSFEDANTISNVATVMPGVQDRISGLAAHATIGWNNFTLIGEFASATGGFQLIELPFNGRGAKPSAWNTELGYTLNLMNKETTLSAAFQGSRESVALALPERRYLAGVAVGIYDHTNLKLQFYRDKDYGLADGGTDRSVSVGKTELVVDF